MLSPAVEVLVVLVSASDLPYVYDLVLSYLSLIKEWQVQRALNDLYPA